MSLNFPDFENLEKEANKRLRGVSIKEESKVFEIASQNLVIAAFIALKKHFTHPTREHESDQNRNKNIYILKSLQNKASATLPKVV